MLDSHFVRPQLSHESSHRERKDLNLSIAAYRDAATCPYQCVDSLSQSFVAASHCNDVMRIMGYRRGEGSVPDAESLDVCNLRNRRRISVVRDYLGYAGIDVCDNVSVCILYRVRRSMMPKPESSTVRWSQA